MFTITIYFQLGIIIDALNIYIFFNPNKSGGTRKKSNASMTNGVLAAGLFRCRAWPVVKKSTQSLVKNGLFKF